MADIFRADFRKGDYAHMASFFAENATYMHSGRETIEGRHDIERYWKSAHEHGVIDFRVVVDKVETLGSLAYEIGHATALIRNESDAQETTDSVRYLVLWKRSEDGVWRILVDISNKMIQKSP